MTDKSCDDCKTVPSISVLTGDV